METGRKRRSPAASRELSQRIYDLFSALRGIRKAGFRGVMEFLQRRGQVGYPPSVATNP